MTFCSFTRVIIYNCSIFIHIHISICRYFSDKLRRNHKTWCVSSIPTTLQATISLHSPLYLSTKQGWGSKPNASRGSKPNAQCQVLFYDRGSKANANVPKTWQAWHFGEGRTRTRGGQNRTRGPFLVAGAGLWLCHLQRSGSILFYLLDSMYMWQAGHCGRVEPECGGQRRMRGPFLVVGAAH